MIVPGSRDTTFFAGEELYRFYEYNGGTSSGFKHILYTNDVSSMPQHFLLLEAVYIGLSFALFVHALKTNRIYLWAGFFGYGVVMETVGFVIKSHLHGQFLLQIFTFLPLKEVAWYPVFLYPAYVTASRISFSSRLGRASMFGILAILSDVAYEMSNGRKGVNVAFINPRCEHAVLTLDNRFLDASMSICMSVALLAFTHSLVIDFINQREYPSFVKATVIACCFPFQWLFFVPLALSQALLCQGKRCPHESLLRPGVIFSLLMAVKLLGVLLTIQTPSKPSKVRLSGMCLCALGVNATCLYFLYIANDDLSHRVDAAWGILVVSLLTCGAHCLGTRYDFKESKTKKA